MKKLVFDVANQDGILTLRYILDLNDIYDDSVASKAATLSNVIPFEYSNQDGVAKITAYVNNNTSLSSLMEERLNKKSVLQIIYGLACAFEIGINGIPVSYIVKDADYIYINKEDMSVKVVLMPIKQEAMDFSEVPSLFRNIISSMRFDDVDSDNYVARIITLINSSDFSVRKIKQYVIEQLDRMGISVDKNSIAKMPGTIPVNQVKRQPAAGPILANSAMISDKTGELSKQLAGGLVGQFGTRPIPHLVRKSTGEIINITKTVFSIGKSALKADYALENNMAISRVHCIIIQRDGMNYIKDNNSTNHTFVDGVELKPGKELLLKNKMVIQLGDEEFTFLLRKGE